MGEGNRKLSKRDPQSNLYLYREHGFIPEGLVNYLALLGWSIADDRDIFTLAEMVAAFDVTRVNAQPGALRPKKAEAINATHLRLLPATTSPSGWLPYLAGPAWSPTRRPRSSAACSRPSPRWSRSA